MREKPSYVMYARIDGEPKPTERLIAMFQAFDEFAMDMYRTVYDKLNGKEKLALHEKAITAGLRS